MTFKNLHSRAAGPIGERKTPFRRYAVASLAAGLITTALATATPATAASVLFTSVPTANACGPLPGIGGLSAVVLFAPGNVLPNTILQPQDSKVVAATIDRATWGLNAYAPPAAGVINPGNLCFFENCTAATLTLTCAPVGLDGAIDEDAGATVRWPNAE